MAETEKTISALVSSQLPDFVRADHPKFQRFVELYYEWLEQNSTTGISNTAGNTIFHAMNIEDYRDIDETPDDFVRYFKQELLPYFPENTSLDLKKILKSAREFYTKKGSEESLKWLFKALFNEDIEVNYPREQILKTSDGKWKKPKAFRITVGESNKNLDVNLLEKKLVVGSVSGATCVIESANRTIDVTNGIEVIEIYISNITRYFENGEYINVTYTDTDGNEKVFSEKIIGTISNIRIDSNIRTDPRQKRRGLLYNVGDPIVITGGLALTSEANDAVAIVGSVTVGSIEGVTTTFPGYGYREYSNTEVIVLRSLGDDPNSNLNTDLRVLGINATACTTNSQQNFIESITYDKTVIDFLGETVIGSANLAAFTVNNRNVVLNVTENDSGDPFTQFNRVWANGNNYYDALFTGRVATRSDTIFGLGGVANTGDLVVYDVQGSNGDLLSVASLTNILNSGIQINVLTPNDTAEKSFVYNSTTTYYLATNANSYIAQALDLNTVNTYGISLITVKDGGYGFRSAPTLDIQSHYDTHLSDSYDYEDQKTLKRQYWQTFKDLGLIAHIYINNGGSGYSVGDALTFSGRGYGANGYVQSVGTGGKITSVVLDNRGEGYLLRPNISVVSSGTGAVLTGYLFGDGVENTVETNAIGRIRDIRLVYRGYDYVATPNVSLKVVDTIINPIPEAQSFTETEYIYQGASLATSTFRANVKQYVRSTNLLRLYNYSGSIDTTVDFKTQNGVFANVNTAVTVPAPAQYSSIIIATGLPNPMYYGNGKAKAKALFANGLIEFNGFYLNTDGFPSSDKRLQDDTIYHNFSYIIQSERNLIDFEVPIKNIIHPAGLELIAKTIIKTTQENEFVSTSNVDLIRPIETSSTITVANSYANVVTGSGTMFDTQPSTKVNPGDLFVIIDDSNPLRAISRVVEVVNSDTSLNVYGDFIYTGQGKLTTNGSCTYVNIFNNQNTISDFVQVSDKIRFRVANNQVSGTVNVSGTTIVGNTTSPNVTHFLGNVVVGSVVTVNNEVRTVTVVTDNHNLTVNSAFTNAATNKYLYANSVLVKEVAGIGLDTLTLNTAPFANVSNVVYQIVPDYASVGYSYKVISLG